MKREPKRSHRPDRKNVYCPFYGRCLDHAAKHYWESWDCSGCPHRSKKERAKVNQITDGCGPYCELPSDICRQVRTGFGAL